MGVVRDRPQCMWWGGGAFVEHTEMERLQRRLAGVERRLYLVLVGWVVSVVVLALGGLAAPASSQPQVVRTSAVEIVDATGRVRMTLDAVNRRPSLWLYDSAGLRRIGFTVGIHGTADAVLNDANGRPRIALRVGYERAADVRLIDSLGRPRIAQSVGYDDAAGLWMFDRLARPRIGLKVFAGGIPGLWLFENPSGHILFSAP
jgi:hypothetical protein